MCIHFLDAASSLFSGFAATSIDSFVLNSMISRVFGGLLRAEGLGHACFDTRTHTHTRTESNSSESGFCFTSGCDE